VTTSTSVRTPTANRFLIGTIPVLSQPLSTFLRRATIASSCRRSHSSTVDQIFVSKTNSFLAPSLHLVAPAFHPVPTSAFTRWQRVGTWQLWADGVENGIKFRPPAVVVAPLTLSASPAHAFLVSHTHPNVERDLWSRTRRQIVSKSQQCLDQPLFSSAPGAQRASHPRQQSFPVQLQLGHL
jgi:hypothetical protein